MNKILFPALASLLALAACSAELGSVTDNATEIAEGGIAAEIQEVKAPTGTETCSAEVTYLVVRVPSSQATDAINAELDRTNGLDGMCEDGTFAAYGGMSVSLNGHSLLSVLESGSSDSEGAAHPSSYVQTFVFALDTGARMSLSDLVGAENIPKVVEQCADAYVAQFGDDAGDRSYLVENCRFALDPEYGPGKFQVEAAGLRIHGSFPHVAFVFEAEGALIPWADLDGLVQQPLVNAMLDRQAS